MPFVYDPNLDDDQKQKDASQVQISGAAPTADTGGTTGNKTGPEASQNTGSGFQNLDKYLQTNQSQEFGNQVTGKVQDQVTQARGNIDSASGQFGQKVQSANTLPGQQDVNNAIANPTGADQKQFQHWESQKYTGPNSLAEDADDYNKFWSGTNQANTQAQLLGTEPGRFSLLDSYFGRPTYGFGQKSLDNLLIQQGGVGEKTKDLQDQAAQLKTYGNDQTKNLQNQASTRAGEVDQSRQGVRSAIGLDDTGNVITGEKAGAIGQQYKSAQDALAAANSQRQAEIQSALSGLQAGKLTPDQAQAMGVTLGQKLYDVDPSKYFTGGQNLNINQTMTPEQRSYIQALSQLAGITDTFANGTAQDKGKDYSFDPNRLAADVASRGAAYQKALQDTPVNIDYRDRGGQLTTMTLKQAQEGIDSIRRDAANGIDAYPNSNREFMARAVPAVAAMQAKLAQQFQVNRTLGENPLMRPRIGPQVRPNIDYKLPG